MATKATTEPIRLIVDVSPNKYVDDTLDASVIVVYLEDCVKIRNCSWSYLGDRGAEYADLKVTGSLRRDSNDTDFFYGYDPLEYKEIFTVNLKRAESITKTLRRINKKIEAISDKFGRPTDFASFLGYFAQAVGANDDTRVFARKVGGGGWSYDDGVYDWMDVNGLRTYFLEKIRDWKGES